MPTPRQYPDNAARHRAYRQRREQARREAMAAKGLPGLPALPAKPGRARWAALQAQAKLLLELYRDEMQEYYEERSERWQESERGEAMSQCLATCADLLGAWDDLSEV